MINKKLILILTVFFTTNLYSQKIEFNINKYDEMAPSTFGFTYKTKHGTRRIGSYHGFGISQKNFDAINLTVNGKKYMNRKIFDVNEKEVLEHQGKVYVSYNNPRFPDVVHYDTLIYAYPESISLNGTKINALGKKLLSINVLYSNGTRKNLNGKMLNAFLTNYGYSISADYATFQIDYLTSTNSLISTAVKELPILNNSDSIKENNIYVTPKVANRNTLPSHIRYIVSGKEYSSSHLQTLHYGGSTVIDFSGVDGRSSSDNGSHGDNVIIFVKELNDSLYEVTIQNNRDGKEDAFLINPKITEITIEAKGGKGANGVSGDRGEDARNWNQFATSDSRCLGQKGEDGFRGGDGGRGGDVSIYYPKSFKAYLNIIVVINTGGASGRGGKGGRGGYHQKLESQEGKLIDALLPDRAVNGREGQDGRLGLSGKTSFILTD